MKRAKDPTRAAVGYAELATVAGVACFFRVHPAPSILPTEMKHLSCNCPRAVRLITDRAVLVWHDVSCGEAYA